MADSCSADQTALIANAVVSDIVAEVAVKSSEVETIQDPETYNE